MNDLFMIELFLNEAKSQSKIICDMLSGVQKFSAPEAERAANTLKGSARMLAYGQYADLSAKLEVAFSSDKCDYTDENLVKSAKMLCEIANLTPEKLEEFLVKKESDFTALINSHFNQTLPESKEKQLNAADISKGTSIKIDSSMKGLFLEETKAQLGKFSQGLLDIEGDFTNPQKLEHLMRCSHSLKGAARVVGLNSIVDFTHEMENCFVAAQHSKLVLTSDSLDIFFNCADFLSNLADVEFSSIDTKRLNLLLQNLKQFEEGKYTPSTSGSGGNVQNNSSQISSSLKSSQSPVSEDYNSNISKKRNDTTVKVSAKNLNSIMELTAESLVENRRIENFKSSISDIKSSQERFVKSLENLIYLSEKLNVEPHFAERVERLRQGVNLSIEKLRDQVDSIGSFSRRNIQLSARLYSEVLASRMRPLSDGVQIFPRMVRDLARSSGKKIILEIEGKDVSVDRDVLERLESPLTHLLRNACDHAIEPPQEREKLGKNPTGRVTISAWHSSGALMLRVSDDGAGINEPKIRQKILERKLVSEEILSKMTSQEVMAFLFLPGFTTKEQISLLSGRGVGLDVVNTMVQEVDGTIEVTSRTGLGAEFTMRLPITRSVVKSLLISIDNQPYSIALTRVYRTVLIKRKDIKVSDKKVFFDLNDEQVDLINTATVLGFEPRTNYSEDIYAVVIRDSQKLYAFEVDSAPEEKDLVVRPPNAALGKIPCVAATSLTEDGFPILILDVEDLLKSAQKYLSNSRISPSDIVEKKDFRKKILVVDDSSTVRETQRQILTGAGFEVDLATDGMDGWNSVRLSDYDLIVSDIDMPRMNGFDLVKRIRNRNKNIPIIIVSYKDRIEDRRRATKVGANAYLSKNSFQDDSFLATVKKFLK